MSLPDGKTWLAPVEPAPKPIGPGWKFAYGVLIALVISSSGWSVWNNLYWTSPPQWLDTVSGSRWGVVYYGPALHGDYHYTLVTLGGEPISLSCEPVYSRYISNDCLKPLAVNGVAQWRPDARKSVAPGPLVEVGYIWSEADERFNVVAVSARRNGIDYLDRRARLVEAGIDPSGRSYSEIRFRHAQRQKRAMREP